MMRFVYDAQGRRVRKDSGSVSLLMVYDAAGELVSEYVPPSAPGTVYVTADHLGSVRLLTDRNGVEQDPLMESP